MALKQMSSKEFIDKILNKERDFSSIKLYDFNLSDHESFTELQSCLRQQNLKEEPVILNGSDLRYLRADGLYLPYVKARKARLLCAYLCNAELWNADFEEADLEEAELWKADLRCANLEKAILRDADLISANLWKARLGYARLIKADLRCAILREAELENAEIGLADFRDADLEGAKLSKIDLIAAPKLKKSRNLGKVILPK